MSLLADRASAEREARAVKHVERFFAALTALRLPAARALVAPDFQWFDRVLTAEDWSSGPFSRFVSAVPLGVKSLRVVPEDLLAARGPRPYVPRLAGAPLVLADITRGEETVTVAVEVDAAARDPRLLQVFDPGEIRTYLMSLGDPEVAE